MKPFDKKPVNYPLSEYVVLKRFTKIIIEIQFEIQSMGEIHGSYFSAHLDKSQSKWTGADRFLWTTIFAFLITQHDTKLLQSNAFKLGLPKYTIDNHVNHVTHFCSNLVKWDELVIIYNDNVETFQGFYWELFMKDKWIWTIWWFNQYYSSKRINYNTKYAKFVDSNSLHPKSLYTIH